jgi:hypothetical protein
MPRSGSSSGRKRRAAHNARVLAPAVAALAAVFAGSPAWAQDVPTEPVPQPYADQYLVEAEDGFLYDIGTITAPEPLGQRRLAAEWVTYNGDNGALGDEVEQGARGNWRRETLNWGTFDVDAQLVDFDSTFLGREATGTDAVVTVRQSAMAVSEVTMLDTIVGHQRTVLDSLLHGGYRYRLPTSPLLGASGELEGPSGGWRFATGNVGVYRGVALPRFEETGGRLTTVAYDRWINDGLELAGEVAASATTTTFATTRACCSARGMGCPARGTSIPRV